MGTHTAPSPARRSGGLARNFATPDGLLGRIAGRIMAWENARANRLVVELLAPGPGDRVLEIGCGPGTALAGAARGGATLLAGIDPSPVMLAQSRRRLRRAGAGGRADLRRAAAEAIPHPEASFTRVLSVHSLHHWDDVALGVREAARVLAPGGRLALADRRRRPGTHLDPHARVLGEDDLTAICALAAEAGLDDVRIVEHDLGREILAVVSAGRR